MGTDASKRTMSEMVMSSSRRKRESAHSLARVFAMHAAMNESLLLSHE
jgi:hypothetical protein